MIMLQTVLFSLFGFAMGSILYSYLLPKLFTGLDITQCSEDGNPGATNAILYGSVRLGALCLALDIAKGALPVFWATRVLDPSSYLFVPVMLAPVLGHAFSPFLKGRGGKGIAVTFGVLLGVLPLSPMVFSLAALLLFFTFVIKITPDGVRVILAMLLFLILCFRFHRAFPPLAAGAMLCATVVIAKHLMNFDRTPVKIGLYWHIRQVEHRQKKHQEEHP